MPIEHYKGLEICIMYNDNQKPYYIVCKEFKEDPFWEIGTTEYSLSLIHISEPTRPY